MALSPEDAAFVCEQFGIDVDRPLICQVSRFDPWKDPMGVIDAYRLVREEMPEVQLALVGSMATDDPEGWEFFHRTFSYADGDPDIKILNNLNNVGAIEVNAFQSQADVVMQKSLREGFGLTVTEALWKVRPIDRRQRRRDPAADRGRRDRLPGLLARGGRRALARASCATPSSPSSLGPGRQGARPRALPDPAPAARLAPTVRGARAVTRERSMSRTAPGDRLQPRPGGVRARRGRRAHRAARRRRPGHGAQRAGRPPRRALDRLGDDRRGRRGQPRGRRASR